MDDSIFYFDASDGDIPLGYSVSVLGEDDSFASCCPTANFRTGSTFTMPHCSEQIGFPRILPSDLLADSKLREIGNERHQSFMLANKENQPQVSSCTSSDQKLSEKSKIPHNAPRNSTRKRQSESKNCNADGTDDLNLEKTTEMGSVVLHFPCQKSPPLQDYIIDEIATAKTPRKKKAEKIPALQACSPKPCRADEICELLLNDESEMNWPSTSGTTKNKGKPVKISTPPPNLQIVKEMSEWAIILLKGQICVEGYIRDETDGPLLLRTSSVADVEDSGNTIITSGRSRYKLLGEMLVKASVQSGVSIDVANKFSKGFPPEWKGYCRHRSSSNRNFDDNIPPAAKNGQSSEKERSVVSSHHVTGAGGDRNCERPAAMLSSPPPRDATNISDGSCEKPVAKLPRDATNILDGSCEKPAEKLQSPPRDARNMSDESFEKPAAKLPSPPRDATNISDGSCERPAAKLPSPLRDATNISDGSCERAAAKLPSPPRDATNISDGSCERPAAKLSSPPQDATNISDGSFEKPAAKLPSPPREDATNISDGGCTRPAVKLFSPPGAKTGKYASSHLTPVPEELYTPEQRNYTNLTQPPTPVWTGATRSMSQSKKRKTTKSSVKSLAAHGTKSCQKMKQITPRTNTMQKTQKKSCAKVAISTAKGDSITAIPTPVDTPSVYRTRSGREVKPVATWVELSPAYQKPLRKPLSRSCKSIGSVSKNKFQTPVVTSLGQATAPILDKKSKNDIRDAKEKRARRKSAKTLYTPNFKRDPPARSQQSEPSKRIVKKMPLNLKQGEEKYICGSLKKDNDSKKARKSRRKIKPNTKSSVRIETSSEDAESPQHFSDAETCGMRKDGEPKKARKSRKIKTNTKSSVRIESSGENAESPQHISDAETCRMRNDVVDISGRTLRTRSYKVRLTELDAREIPQILFTTSLESHKPSDFKKSKSGTRMRATKRSKEDDATPCKKLKKCDNQTAEPLPKRGDIKENNDVFISSKKGVNIKKQPQKTIAKKNEAKNKGETQKTWNNWQKTKLKRFVTDAKSLDWNEISQQMGFPPQECEKVYAAMFRGKRKTAPEEKQNAGTVVITARPGTLKHRKQVRQHLEVMKIPKFHDLFASESSAGNIFSADLFSVPGTSDNFVPVTPNSKPPVGFDESVLTPAWFKTPTSSAPKFLDDGWTPLESTPAALKEIFSPRAEVGNKEEKSKDADRIIVQMRSKMMRGTLREFKNKKTGVVMEKEKSQNNRKSSIDFEIVKNARPNEDEEEESDQDEYFDDSID